VIDTSKLLTIIIESGSFISVFAAIVAAAIMLKLTKKFGSGILASGFKAISLGVFVIAVGILVDAVLRYINNANFQSLEQISTALEILKLVLFVAGTYIIVIGSKKTGDNLESLTKK
jgi:O-antigen/teichoic acid export membrane protein